MLKDLIIILVLVLNIWMEVWSSHRLYWIVLRKWNFPFLLFLIGMPWEKFLFRFAFLFILLWRNNQSLLFFHKDLCLNYTRCFYFLKALLFWKFLLSRGAGIYFLIWLFKQLTLTHVFSKSLFGQARELWALLLHFQSNCCWNSSIQYWNRAWCSLMI